MASIFPLSSLPFLYMPLTTPLESTLSPTAMGREIMVDMRREDSKTFFAYPYCLFVMKPAIAGTTLIVRGVIIAAGRLKSGSVMEYSPNMEFAAA